MADNWFHEQWEDTQDFFTDDLGLGAVDDFINDEIPGGYLGVAALGVGGAYLLGGGGAAAAGTAATGAAPAVGLTAGQQLGLAVGAPIVSNYLGGKAADAASKTSAEATDRSIAENRRQFDLIRGDTAPYREAGTNALAQYQTGIQAPRDKFEFNLEGDKGYQFAVGEAERGVNRGAALGGKLGSGNRLAALSDRITGVASQYANDAYNRQYGQNRENYGRDQNYLNRLSGLAGTGQTALAQSGTAGQNYSNNLTNILSRDAANQGQAAYNRYGATNDAFQGAASNYLAYNQNQQLLNALGDN